MTLRPGPMLISLAAFALTCEAARAELPEISPTQTLQPTAAEIAADNDGNLFFGASVSVWGNTALVGVPSGGGEVGTVALFKRTSVGWHRAGSLAPSASDGDFGQIVSFEGNTAAVQSASAIYLFHRTDGVWAQSAQLARNAQANEGIPVVYANDLLAYGASWPTGAGRVVVYSVNANGTTGGFTTLVPADPQARDSFGASIAIGNGRIAVGAPRQNAVYVFQLVRSLLRISQ